MSDLQPGQKAYWTYRARWYRRWYKRDDGLRRYDPVARVLRVEKHTAHIQIRRDDGTLNQRWIKRDRLIPVGKANQ